MSGQPPTLDEQTRAALILLATARPDADRIRRIHEVLAAGVDWPALVQAARHHRVVALVYHALKQHAADAVPAGALRQLRGAFLAYFQMSFGIRSALPDLLERLAEASVEPLLFKGPALAATVYGDDKLRPYSDVDVLVRPEEVEAADAVLRAAGFEACDPLPAALYTHGRAFQPFQPWHANACGYVRAEDAGRAFNVDLHWGLASRYFQADLDPMCFWKRRVGVTLEGGVDVDTFAPEDTLIHLCLHGTKHNWRRLSYLCDVAELLRTYPALDARAVRERAIAFHCERMVLLGVALARQVLGAPLPEALAAVPVHSGIESLSYDVQRALFEPLSLRQMLALQWRVRDRRRDSLGTCTYRVQQALQPSQTDRDWVRLPPPLGFLYYFVRPVRLMAGAFRMPASPSKSP